MGEPMRGCTVNFYGPNSQVQRFRVPNAAVAAVLVLSWATDHHWVLTFRGTPADLIAAGVADELMLDFRGRKHERAGRDEFGDKFHITRRGRGRVELVRWFDQDAHDPAITNESAAAATALLAGWVRL
jgi:hypothetical protein